MSRAFASALMLASLMWSAGAWAQAVLPERLFIAEFLVEGNSVLPQTEIERAVIPFLGPDRPAGDIDRARDALAKVYEKAGYLGVSVDKLRADPVSTEWGEGFVIVLQAVEGPVARLRVTGAEYTLPSRVKEQVPSAAEGKVLNFPDFQEDLAQAARLPGASVTPVLKPGRDPGTMEVELKVQDQPAAGAWVQVNNDQSPDTTPRRLEVGARYDNLFQASHSLNLRYITTPLDTDEIKVAVVNYSLPVGRDTRLSVYGVKSDSNVTSDIGTGVIGKGTTIGVRLSLPLQGRPGLYQNLTVGFDWKDLDEDSAEAGSKPLQYLPLSAQHLGVWSGESGSWTLSNSLTTNIGGFVERELSRCGSVKEPVDQFACRRTGASSSFMVWGGSLKREQRVDLDWLGTWTADLRADWQFASEPLIPNEQFYLGGRESVRGYLQSEQGGDHGGALSLELGTPSLLPADWGASLRLIGFYEGGVLKRTEPLAGEQTDWVLASAGSGLRFLWGRWVTGSLDWARTFHPGSKTRDGASRLHAHIRLEY